MQGQEHLHVSGEQPGDAADGVSARLPQREDPARHAQVSCDWWRAGHVTLILTSDWSRPAASGGLTSASEADTIVTCDVFPIMNNVPMTKYHGA